jgi:hypothetical protein
MGITVSILLAQLSVLEHELVERNGPTSHRRSQAEPQFRELSHADSDRPTIRLND